MEPTLSGEEDVASPGPDVLPDLVEFAEAASSLRTLRVIVKALSRKIAAACQVDRCSVFLVHEERLVPIMSQFAAGVTDRTAWRTFKGLGPYALDDVPALARAIRERHPVVVDDGLATELLPVQWTTTFGVRSLLVLPLVRGDEVIGTLLLDNCRSAPVGESCLPLARALAAHLALAIDGARSAEDTRARLRDMETLLGVSQIVASSTDLQDAGRWITREAARAVGADSAGIYVAEQDGLRPLAGYHIPRRFLEMMHSDPLLVQSQERLGEFLKKSGRALSSDDVPNDHVFRHEIFRRFPVQSIILIPLRAREERVGVLVCVWWTKRRRLTPAEMRLVEGIAAQAALAVVRARLQREAEAAAVQRERTRLDGVIHDTLSQTLFSMAVRLEVFRDRFRHTKPSALEEFRRDVALMTSQVRQLLTPGPSVANGFSARLQTLIEKFRSPNVQVDLTHHGDMGRLSPLQEEALETIFREGLAAVVTRGRSSQITLRMEIWPDEVQVELADDDTDGGIEWLGEPPAHGGLQSALQSLVALGGQVEFWERRPAGLRLRACLPLP